MNESLLLKLAVVFSFTGIIVLYLISRNIEINDTTIEKINKEELDNEVKVTGRITSVINREGLTVLEISEQTKISVLLFNNELNFTKGNVVEVHGKIDEYNENRQVIANSVKVVS
ncbi:OB-fold nucleic acid binding domain-containing protein [Candidatus Woesearchaeota archaeon]|nr:OB-fold nucleic acid binding domain-containing protein [Candidatus Woesearchaeota archaeon]